MFEHYSATTRPATSDIVESENAAWRLGEPNCRAGRQRLGTKPFATIGVVPYRKRHRTIGRVDVHPRLHRSAHTREDSSATCASPAPAQSAATAWWPRYRTSTSKSPRPCWLDPDVTFTPTASNSVEHTTIIESHHTRLPADGYTVAEWFNTQGYEQAGRVAARRPGTVAFVVVHDFRQALAFLSDAPERRHLLAAQRATTVPIGTP